MHTNIFPHNLPINDDFWLKCYLWVGFTSVKLSSGSLRILLCSIIKKQVVWARIETSSTSQEADTDDQQGTLTYEEFSVFYKMMSLRRDLFLLMMAYSDRKDHLTVEELANFLRNEQKVRGRFGVQPFFWYRLWVHRCLLTLAVAFSRFTQEESSPLSLPGIALFQQLPFSAVYLIFFASYSLSWIHISSHVTLCIWSPSKDLKQALLFFVLADKLQHLKV